MEFDYIKTDKLLVVKIIEEIDHHTTEKIRRKRYEQTVPDPTY